MLYPVLHRLDRNGLDKGCSGLALVHPLRGHYAVAAGGLGFVEQLVSQVNNVFRERSRQYSTVITPKLAVM